MKRNSVTRARAAARRARTRSDASVARTVLPSTGLRRASTPTGQPAPGGAAFTSFASAARVQAELHAPLAAESATLHRRIRADIERRIITGEWHPGDRIPFEHELMQQYDCSRMTVNKAMGSLAESGLIVRRRRAGSFVAQPRIHSVLLEIPDIQAEITARSEQYGLKLLARRRRKPASNRPEEKILAGKGELLALRCLHLANDRPFALEDRLISLASVPDAAHVDFTAESPGTWLLAHVPWTQAEHRITAVNADRDTAAALDIEPRTACLALERRTWRASEHITHVRQIFPGTHYDLIARFTPKTHA